MFAKMIFENKDLCIGYDKSFDEQKRVLVAARDRGSQTECERWVIAHISVDKVRKLRDDLDEFLKKWKIKSSYQKG
ncbi:hypothetical protein DW790_05695 [Firmicutes bacterium AM31-12AC]|nr:hypothetical protein DW790_05695 [Firmicutes bacterium AM31-12AC]